jgi:hypothetical protein
MKSASKLWALQWTIFSAKPDCAKRKGRQHFAGGLFLYIKRNFGLSCAGGFGGSGSGEVSLSSKGSR